MTSAAIPALSVGVNHPLKIPPRMMTGSRIGPRTRPVARRRSFPSKLLDPAISGCRLTQIAMYVASPTTISTAGRIDPANRAPVEIDAVAAKSTAGMLGGMIVLSSEPDAVRPAENP